MLLFTNLDMSSYIRSERMEGNKLFGFNTRRINITNSEKRRYKCGDGS